MIAFFNFNSLLLFLRCPCCNFYSNRPLSLYLFLFILQHECFIWTLDNNVLEEIRNFKKCLIMIFAKQEKDPMFLERVISLAWQRHHCLVECIPLPQETAKQAPLYFKNVSFMLISFNMSISQLFCLPVDLWCPL